MPSLRRNKLFVCATDSVLAGTPKLRVEVRSLVLTTFSRVVLNTVLSTEAKERLNVRHEVQRNRFRGEEDCRTLNAKLFEIGRMS